MTADLDRDIAEVLGRRIDADGGFPGECHDLWVWWLYKLGGRPGEGWAPGDGSTANVFYQFGKVRPRLTELFTQHHGASGIRKGDVVFWERNAWYPGTHVAIATGPVEGELLPCYTQNPGPVRFARLITRGIIGYLRPRAYSPSNESTTEQDQDMRKLWLYTPTNSLIIADHLNMTLRNLGNKENVERAAFSAMPYTKIAEPAWTQTFAGFRYVTAPDIPVGAVDPEAIGAVVAKAVGKLGAQATAEELASLVSHALADELAEIPAATAAEIGRRIS